MPKHAQVKTYLGDSVYAIYDEDGTIVLTTENGMPADPSNVIYLEPAVYEALVAFAERIRLTAAASDDLLEWPCQNMHGGKMPFADRAMCKHPECHPRNADPGAAHEMPTSEDIERKE